MWSFAEAKKDLKAPRLPPVDIKDTNSLFTTYAAYLNMMFGKRNAHLIRLNAVRARLRAMRGALLQKMYIPNTIWWVTCDAQEHFSAVILPRDLELSMTASRILWPGSGLEMFAINMASSTYNERFDMPEEWRAAILTNRYYGDNSGLSDKNGGAGGYPGNGGGGDGRKSACGDYGGGNKANGGQAHGGGGRGRGGGGGRGNGRRNGRRGDGGRGRRNGGGGRGNSIRRGRNTTWDYGQRTTKRGTLTWSTRTFARRSRRC